MQYAPHGVGLAGVLMLPRVEQALDALGIPDPETHCVCIRCGKWFKPDQGSWVALEGRFARNYSLSTGVGGRFRCARCTRIRRLTKYGIWATFLGLLLLVWLLTSLGVMK